ncbi:cytochrome b [Oceanicella actignis]|uniref:cytochrome b n=1 Tax=Oceanicella actignis TaxID=1189325 RepID=UPI0011E63D11|nr:cytochrome b [Oceanicella actignis]TYO90861.1 cytochrome b561 [Oceanicella actignis]
MTRLITDAEGWGLPTRLLHWSMAGVILFMLGLGFYMSNAPIDIYAQFAWVQLHKSWGFVAFALAVLRIAWRLFEGRSPAPPPGMSRAERALARAGHLSLYALMIAMPVTGWLMASASPLQDAYGIRNMVFGLFELPDPFRPGDQAMADALRRAHFLCALALSAVVAGHAAAALRHHFVLRDNVLRRMLIGR